MNDLVQIKKVEYDVLKQIDDARQVSVQSVVGTRSQGGEIIQKKVDKARTEVSKAIEKAKSEAKRDSEKIIANGKAEVSKIQLYASKNEAESIQFVLKKLRGD